MPTTLSLRRGLVAAALCVGAAVTHTLPSGTGIAARAADPDRSLINALNECLQKEFKQVGDRFGMARMPIAGPHNSSLSYPCSPETRDDFEAARLRVVTYLIGRSVLKERPQSTSTASADVIAHGTIKGPFEVVPRLRRAPGMPEPLPGLEVWDESRRALLGFDTSEAFDFAKSGWQFAARPIRATEETCLNCHTRNGATLMSAGVGGRNTLQIGDAVGLLLYGYQKVR